MREMLERLLRSADVPNPERAETLWAEYRAGGAGADAAFATLLAWHGLALYRRIWGFVRSDAADDVFQEVIARLHRERPNLETFTHALRWLRTVAVTQCVDAYRREVRRKARELAAAVPTEAPTPALPFESEEALRAALSKLSQREQQAVALVYFEGMTRQDAAAALGVQRNTFAKVLDGALARLRSTLATAAVAGTAATTATIEAALGTRPLPLSADRLAELATAAWEKARTLGRPAVGPWWLPGHAKVLAGVVVGGLVAVSLALISRSDDMPTASPAKTTARLGVERLEARDNPAGGVLDTTFGVGGAVLLPSTAASAVRETAVQPDGKILAVGWAVQSTTVFGDTLQATVTRLNPNGTIDTTFGTGGTVKLPRTNGTNGFAVALQPDGKILVGVQAYAKKDDGQYAVARLNPNGTLDTSFGNNNGWWLANPTNRNETVKELEVVSNGTSFSIYVGGDAATPDNSQGFAVVKIDATGRPDSTYGSGGFAVRHVGTTLNSTYGLAVTPSGRAILINPKYIVAFNSSGQPDASFNGTGYIVTLPGTNAVGVNVNSVVAQGENVVVGGTLYLGGGVIPRGYAARYTPSGTLDTAFATDGVYLSPAGLAAAANFQDVAVGANGSISLVGTARAHPANPTFVPGLLVVRLSADGIADTTFGSNGTGLSLLQGTTPGSPFASVGGSANLCITIDSFGNMLIGGQYSSVSPRQGSVIRITGS